MKLPFRFNHTFKKRHKAFVKCTCVIIFAFMAVSTYGQQVGVNINGQFDRVDYNDLQRTKTTWVRGFIDFFQFYENPDLLNTDERIQKYLTLQDNGYKTILNIKWDFSDSAFPEVNSTEMNNIKDFLEILYDKVWDKTDIIVVGNEPFIESRSQDRTADGPLVKFYRQMCIKTKNYRAEHTNIPIYVGSFDNMYLSSKQTQAVNDLLAFAYNHDYMAGIDLHIHHSGINEINTAFDYVYNKIRADQKILVTEYSLMKHWRNYMEETIDGTFASTYGYSASWKNYQYIDYALKNPRPRSEWVDYFKMHSWYNNRANYIMNAYNKFKAYGKFNIATYAIRQSYSLTKDFTASTDPWVLNPLFVNRTVEANPETGYNQFNYAFIDDFRAIQNSTTARLEKEEVEESENILISVMYAYPNPVNGLVNVYNKPADAKLVISDSYGRLLLTTSEDTFSLEKFPAGVYLLRVSGFDDAIKLVKE